MPLADLPPAVETFARAARTMHAAVAAMPRRMSYDVRTDVHAYGDAEYRFHYDVDRATGAAALRIDAGEAPPSPSPSAGVWPIDPAFDPFARFATTGHWRPVGRQDGTFANEPQPMTFDAAKRPGVDVVAIAVNGYVVRYANDPAIASPYVRLQFTATAAVQHAQTVFTSAVVDTRTWMPLQITMRTPVGHSDVVLDYALAGAYPVLAHFRMARPGYSTEAWFDNVRFAESS
jgi:hypothetical protein